MKYSPIRWKYRVAEPFAYRLNCKFSLTAPYSCPYFALTMDGWLLIFEVYAWDGATKFPDFDWIKTPSAIHDALHNAIAAGAIPESENDLIDKELELAIRGNPAARWTKQLLVKLRGWYVRKATNTVNEKKGAAPPVFTVPKLQNEYTIAEFRRITGSNTRTET